MERTLVFLKPDAVQRGLVGEILRRFEAKGLKIVGLKMMTVDRALAERHYGQWKGKPFYSGLIRFITKSPVVVLALEGVEAIAVVRRLMGKTFGREAEPGTIRGDLGMSKAFNLVHGSDSPETAARELALFFRPEELQGYDLTSQPWIYEAEDVAG